MSDEITKKLKYVSEITRGEVKKFTRYDEFKEEIDGFTGYDNLDFPFIKAEVSEYVIRLTLPDGKRLFLPIYATDGLGLRFDKKKQYATVHRPLTKQEKEEEEERKRQEEERKEWEAEQRALNAANLKKAELLVKKKADRKQARENAAQ